MPLSESEIAEIVSRVVGELQNPQPTPQAVSATHFQVLSGQVIAADHVNSLANQAVPKYASLGSLTSGWPAPIVGALAYVADVNALYVYDNQITGGTAAWHVMGGMRMGYAAHTGGQSIPASVDTLVDMSAWSGAANKPGRGTWNQDGSVTVPVAGTYLVSGNITWTAASSGERRLYVKRFTGGNWTFSGVAGGTSEANSAGTTALRQGVTAAVVTVAGDKVGLFARHNHTSAILLVGGVDQPHMGCHLLGAE